MDLLTNIYNILTTENDKLTSLIISPTIFIEGWLVFQLFTAILRLDYTKKQELSYIIIVSLLSKLIAFCIPSPFNIFINYLIMFITIKTIFKTTIIKSILATIIPVAFFAIITILISNPILKIFDITANMLNNVPLFRLIYIITLYTLVFICSYIIRKINLKLILIEDLSKNNKIIIIVNLGLGIITIFYQCLLIHFYIGLLPILISIINFVLLLAYFTISFYSLNRIVKLQITTQNLENAENYNNTLSYLYDNVKAFHHDFDNMLFIIGGFIDNNDIQGLKKYYKNLEKDGERVNNIALLNPTIINNSGIYNLLMSKYKKAQDANVDIKLEFFFDFNRLQMPIYDFSRILGILLDNSIESASESKERIVNILFRDSPNNQTQIISIENTYTNKDIDTSKIFEKGKSSKENHTGMGLWEVKQILKRNNNVVLNTTNDNQYFKQTLEIYYKIKE